MPKSTKEITSKKELEKYPIGSFVSYVNNQNIFRPGGYIIKFLPEYFIYVRSDFSAKYRGRYSHIQKMWIGSVNHTNQKVVNVRVSNIRPDYENLAAWMTDPDNIYIGRGGIVFINGERFPKENSIWYNPFKIDTNNNREQVIQKYKIYIIEKIRKSDLTDELLKLKNKNLGCWCKPSNCHGDVLVELLNSF